MLPMSLGSGCRVLTALILSSLTVWAVELAGCDGTASLPSHGLLRVPSLGLVAEPVARPPAGRARLLLATSL